MVRGLERQSNNRQTAERISGNIHAFPEAAGSEQYRRRIVLKTPDQLAAAPPFYTLPKYSDVLCGQCILKRVIDLP
ncbi:hypothetical protein D3C80_1496600 [compost metagenome]